MKPTDETTASEMANQKAEPLAKAEIALIVGSISLGLISLAVLYWISRVW